MAMASLCATLNRARDLEHNVTRIKFQAFIVNHGVRPDSLAEATWVKQQLNSWGMLFHPILVDCWLTEARTHRQNFGRKMASRWRCAAIIKLRDLGAKTTLSGFR